SPNVHMPCSIDHNRRWKIQQGFPGRTTVATEACDRRCTGRNISHGPAQIRLLGNGVQIDRAAFCKRIAIHSLSHRNGGDSLRSCFTSLNTASDCSNTLGLYVDPPNDVVLRVGDEEVTLWINGETLG